ncbi:hypothetical protein CEXT_247191 [Caerostris extrusa]|uniref:Uncharacterized protein n=1 Tax=Caerostris extrusa TaxID=172846 RepID=A0AAV4WVP0_CAEEX|nr:hypothetical protein CEXT_247191 [Caerostris extrusa]
MRKETDRIHCDTSMESNRGQRTCLLTLSWCAPPTRELVIASDPFNRLIGVVYIESCHVFEIDCCTVVVCCKYLQLLQRN